MRSTARLAAALIAALALAACGGQASRRAHADAVWRSLDTACDLPCWHGLTPGESSPADVRAGLARLDAAAGFECFDLAEADEQGRAGAFCYWESVAAEPVWGGIFQFRREGEERLQHILLYLRRPVSAEEAVAHFGEPDRVWAMQHGLESSACRCRAHPPTVSEEGGPDFDLLYPARGLILSAFAEQPDQWPCLCRLTWIDALALVEPGSADDLDGWWQRVYGYGLAEEGGLFTPFPGWEVPFE